MLRHLEELRACELVTEAGVQSEGNVGRPPKVWQINLRAGYVLGVSIST
ncbi:MAG: hypothetical protein GF320_10855, partial [Armatimonadia bacterium]|nr:hypothetical protein [Armatimonadia bacterium]